jgi:hypothetical protein
VSSLWEQRAARNEALFREVNENIARLEERHGETTTEPVFICECADQGCTDHLPIDIGTYQRAREDPRYFLVLPGHHDPRVEHVIETHTDFLIVEKTGKAGEIAERASD